MILINIAVLITLIGLGIFSFGINQNSISTQDSVGEFTQKKEKKSESNSAQDVVAKSKDIPNVPDDNVKKIGDLSKEVRDLGKEISTRRLELDDVINQIENLNLKIGDLRVEENDLNTEVSKYKLEMAEMQKLQEDRLAKTKEIEEVKLEDKNAKEIAELLKENEELRTTLLQQGDEVLDLREKISQIDGENVSNQTKLIEENASVRLKKLTAAMEKLQIELDTNKASELALNKLVESQKTQIIKIRAANLELEKQLEEAKSDKTSIGIYDGMIATFGGNLVYEPNKKKIILVTPEGIEYTILQDDFPGDLVAKCGLPVSSGSKDRCFATISAQIFVEDGDLVLKGREIKEITKK